MKIALAADHGGFDLKQVIKSHLETKGIEVMDFGTYTNESCDYPVYAHQAAKAVKEQTCDFGILVCGTGVGISIAANKVPGIRCALVHDVFTAKATRAHNNSNMLAMGGRVIGDGLALMIVDIFLDTTFEGGRHQKRLDLITEMEALYEGSDF